MILLFFVLTLTTAFHFELLRISSFTNEIGVILRTSPNAFVDLTYLVGSIFFLFWSEPYIMPNGFYILAWIQGISFLVNSIGGSKKSMTWNKYECVITLGILSLIAYHAIKYFILFA